MMVAAVAVAVVALPPSQIFLKNVQNHYHHRYPPTVLVTNTLPASSSRLSCQPQPAIGGVGPKGFLRHKTPKKKNVASPRMLGTSWAFPPPLGMHSHLWEAPYRTLQKTAAKKKHSPIPFPQLGVLGLPNGKKKFH